MSPYRLVGMARESGGSVIVLLAAAASSHAEKESWSCRGYIAYVVIPSMYIVDD